MRPWGFKVECLMFQLLFNVFPLLIFLVKYGILDINLALKHLTESLGFGH